MSLTLEQGYNLVDELVAEHGFSPNDFVVAGHFAAAAQGYDGRRPIGDVDVLLWEDKAKSLARSGAVELVEGRSDLQGSLAYFSDTLPAMYFRTRRGEYDTRVEIGSAGSYPYGLLVPGAEQIWSQAQDTHGYQTESMSHVKVFKNFYGREKDAADAAYYEQVELHRQQALQLDSGLIIPEKRPQNEGLSIKMASARPNEPLTLIRTRIPNPGGESPLGPARDNIHYWHPDPKKQGEFQVIPAPLQRNVIPSLARRLRG